MSQLVRGFFGKEDKRERVWKGSHKPQPEAAEETDMMSKELDDHTFEPLEMMTSEKKSNQVSRSRSMQVDPAVDSA